MSEPEGTAAHLPGRPEETEPPSPLDELTAILDRHERARAAIGQAATGPERSAEARERFGSGWAALRDHDLRVTLEEVVWLLEQRGHHAWLEDHGEVWAADLVPTGDETEEVPQPLSLRVLPADRGTDLGAAGELRFVPDPEDLVVHVDAWYGDPSTEPPVRLAPHVDLEALDEGRIVGLATQFVARLLDAGPTT